MKLGTKIKFNPNSAVHEVTKIYSTDPMVVDLVQIDGACRGRRQFRKKLFTYREITTRLYPGTVIQLGSDIMYEVLSHSRFGVTLRQLTGRSRGSVWNRPRLYNYTIVG